MNNERISVEAIRTGLLAHALIYAGESLPIFSVEKDLYWLETDSTLYRDIQRFMDFSNGFVAYDPTRLNVIGDIRYSMLPISAKPLWGIFIDPGRPEAHADYRFFRENAKAVRGPFIAMLFGKDRLATE